MEQLNNYRWHKDGRLWAKRVIFRGSIPDDFIQSKSLYGIAFDMKLKIAQEYAMNWFINEFEYFHLVKDYVDEHTTAQVFYEAATMEMKFTVSMVIPDEVYAQYLFMKG